MANITQIELQLTGWTVSTLSNIAMWNKHKGGPETLLRWLESQLGLLEEPVPLFNRITEFASVLESVPNTCFAKSLETDRWTTASELLLRFEELRLAGWNETHYAGLPPVVQDLARVTCTLQQLLSDPSIRLKRIVDALNNGQVLPQHKCILWDPLNRWPMLFRDVLTHLNTENAPTVPPMAHLDTALASLQQQLESSDIKAVNPDKSFHWIRSRSILGACEAIAVALGCEPDLLDRTIVYCENSTAALCLDGCLARLGLPTMGASLHTLSHPVLQVLPITLRLCWKPVDPELLLDFLSLPIGPIPRYAAKRLAEALAEQPGLGSAEWERVWKELCDPKNDPEGQLASKLKTWLGCGRTTYGQPLPVNIVQERCRLAAHWAASRATAMAKDAIANPEIIYALHIAAGQASALGELAASQGNSITEPQLGRLLEAVAADGIQVQSHLEAAGGPRWVKSLAEIDEPCERLVWLGLGTEDRPACHWTALELQQIRKAGIDIDDGSRELAALRDAERRGFCRVTDSLIAVSLPGEDELQTHPLWQQVQSALEEEKGGGDKALGLEDLLYNGETSSIDPWKIQSVATHIQPPQPRRPQWTVKPGLLHDRHSSSATELTIRLACPLCWVFNYAARLRSSPIANLPDDFLLKGNFCHSILEAAFGAGKPFSNVIAAQKVVGRLFDDRLPLDAAPLAQPGRLAEKMHLRNEILTATRTLVDALNAGNYTVKGMELPTSGSINGRVLDGFIDCLVLREDGEEAVIDFKYKGKKKYRRLLEAGNAVQLATYAYARSQAGNGEFPMVGYLIIADGLLYTPTGSPLYGVAELALVNGNSIKDVWLEFYSALKSTGSWLSKGKKIPCWPLQAPDERPKETEMVIEKLEGITPQEEVEPCKYCDFKILCGMKELI